MPVINRGDDYFAVVTYTGNGTSQTISGLRFQPDFVWIKGRSGATDHALYDAQRGVQSRLESNTTDAQVTSDNGVTAFNSDGFSIGSLAQVNTNGATYVAWCWKEGATQGFDIVTGTSTGTTGTLTLAHSLGVAPAMVIAKNRNLADDWYTWHTSLGASSAGNAIRLNTTAAKFTSTGIWGTGFTSSNLLFGQTNWFSASGQGIVAYAFSEVAGFSRFGSYTGNGSADGPFVFCGFRPRFVMWKNASVAEAWLIEDTARSTYNELALELYPSTSGAETAGSSRSPTQQFDYLSNGFKVRGANNQTNGSGNTIIYAAFSEFPFKNSLAR